MSAAVAAEYILRGVRERGARTWQQAPRNPALELGEAQQSLRIFSEYRIRGVSELAVRGLWLWHGGFPAQLSTSVPAPEQVLELQAKGARFVSLLPPEVRPPLPGDDGLSFALHDLCHLAKFGGAHYEEQVGFFATLAAAFERPAWRAIEAELDDVWLAGRASVSADMNGSSVFLFAVLKMKLKMAARRKLARSEGREAPRGGPLRPAEAVAFDALLGSLLDVIELPADVRAAAHSTSARRDSPEAAGLLASHFRDLGRSILAQKPRPRLSSANG
jgi:hypothetical protein